MLILKAELWPGGSAKYAEALGVVAVRNAKHIESDLYEYEVEVQGQDRAKRATVQHYRRRGWAKLAALALEAVCDG